MSDTGPTDVSMDWREPTRLEIRYTGNLRGDLEALPRLATVIKAERSAHPNIILLDTGDFSSGSQACDRFAGRPVAEVMHHLDYDATVAGAHDVVWGKQGLERLATSAGCPILAANWEGFPGYRTLSRSDLEVTVVGLAWPTPPESVAARDPFPAVAAVLREVGDEGVVLLLSQAGFEVDRRLATELEGIHAILQGICYDGFTQATRFGETLLVPAVAGASSLGSLGLDLSGTLVIEKED